MAAREGPKVDASPGSILLVVHDFIARSADELSLAKGDRIELIERDDDFGDGWFLGRHMTNGDTGLFPEVYTTPAPKGTLSNAANGLRRQADNAQKPAITTDGPPPTSISAASPAATQQRPASAQTPKTSPLVQTALRTSLPNAPSDAHTIDLISSQSPVMSETLGVIDEHITEMNSPRTSYANGDRRNTMSSVYSTQTRGRMSYIAGHETDEEEHMLHTEEEVSMWTPERVAEYLEDNGVEKSHCQVFMEQEISGEVLLAMEQSSIFLKEFDLGPVGRRLRTWHKIKALQDETRMNTVPGAARSTSEYSGANGDNNITRNRSTSSASALPRGLTTGRQNQEISRSSTLQSNSSYQQPRSSVVSPLQTMTSLSRPENTYRPSAHSIRSMNHSRRHSSIDSNVDTTSLRSHKKQPSIDQKWQPSLLQTNGRPGSHGQTMSSNSIEFTQHGSTLTSPGPASPGDLDRGYFSSTEVDSRTKSKPNVLQKKTASTASPQSRTSSFLTQSRKSIQSGRVASSDSLREPISAGMTPSTSYHSDVANAPNQTPGGLRAISMPQYGNKPMMTSKDPVHPVVTKLDYSNGPSLNAIVASSPTTAQGSETSSIVATPSPSGNHMPFFSKHKIPGLRATSEAVTNQEKSQASPDRIPTVKEGEVSSPTRTGSTTPSTETQSVDIPKSGSRASTGSGSNLMPPPQTTKRPRMKTKKETSAYTRGLQKKTPAEMMKDCDYSGWMKKKSGSLMTTWKPRLFVLKGRRLSYFYSENDTEEKGLIDISFHNIVAAHNEKLTGLHATVTGAGSPTSPTHSITPTSASRDLEKHPPPMKEDDSSLFIFKLTPPKSGRGVTFTKPTVHYFAVNSRQEGRLWMAALMKAVIDRDADGVVTTTYNQKTISLAKARARRERPPALKEETMEDRSELAAGDALAGAEEGGDFDEEGSKIVVVPHSEGLGIGGIGGGDESVDLGEKGAFEDGQSSLAPSTSAATATGTEADSSEVGLNEKEREAVALNAPS